MEMQPYHSFWVMLVVCMSAVRKSWIVCINHVDQVGIQVRCDGQDRPDFGGKW